MSSSSSSSGVGSNNAQFGQTQNTIPAPGFGYNYGNFYPSYPIYSSFGSINPGNPVQATASLNSRFGNDVAAPTVAQIPFNPQLYGANSVVAPLDYGQYLNNLRLQQQNAYVQIGFHSNCLSTLNFRFTSVSSTDDTLDDYHIIIMIVR